MGGLTIPTTAAWAPGRPPVHRRRNRALLKVLDQGQTRARSTILDISDEVNDAYDRGLLGLAIDTDYETNHYVYLLYTAEKHPLMADTDAPDVLTARARAGERLELGVRAGRSCSGATASWAPMAPTASRRTS